MAYAFKAGWVLGALLLVAGVAQAQIYVWTDPATGKKVYSDQPPPANAKDAKTKSFGANLTSSGDLPFAVKEAMRKNPVVLYANQCDSCKKGVNLLTERGIPYTSKNPETDVDALATVKKLTGVQEVPVLTVGTNTVKGFNESSWNAALDAAGYPKSSMKGLKVNGDVPDKAKPAPVPAPATKPVTKPAAPAYP
ncbi:glutaredoxin family protein [Leeia oryzae]|uniref:glutaredoxin family protein n=1 Tax=Leeia oryzae TaxID=356662 RepID=UPI000381B588|nr:glutaredoxin family protein [Leeia oryzae]